MELFLDTANLKDIKRAQEFYPILGITTNPSIIAKENNVDFYNIVKNIRDVIGNSSLLHVQMVGKTAEIMVDEFACLEDKIGGELVAKIPLTEQGLKAMRLLAAKGKRITATAVITPMQALMAAQAGAEYIAPYLNRMQNIGIDAIEAIALMVQILDNSSTGAKILAASFKNVGQMNDVARVGCHSATVNPETFFQSIQHPLTDSGLAGFEKDWQSIYHNKTLLDL